MRCDARNTEPIDPELWLRDVHAANDNEVVSWFAGIRGTGTLSREARTPKRRRLDGDTRRWEHHLAASDKLTRQHAQRAYDAYCNAHDGTYKNYAHCTPTH